MSFSLDYEVIVDERVFQHHRPYLARSFANHWRHRRRRAVNIDSFRMRASSTISAADWPTLLRGCDRRDPSYKH